MKARPCSARRSRTFSKLGGGEAVVTSILRAQLQRITPFPDAVLREGDIVLIEGDPRRSTAWSRRRD